MLKYAIGIAAVIATSAAQAQSVDWDWKRAHRCAKESPALKVTGIPEGARQLRVRMVDNDATHFNHGGGEVAHDGGAAAAIPEGALKAYTGPCPPNFGSFGHDYTFSVFAVGADGKEVPVATGTKNFSAKSVPQ